MIVLTGGDLVLPNGVVSGSLVIDGPRIAAIEPGHSVPPGAEVRSIRDCYAVPGFIDVHVHGVAGIDTLDGPAAVGDIAAILPRYGVTAFCPTSVACDPETLGRFLGAVAAARAAPRTGVASVLPAHLESNFINPEWNGAQPARCLRTYHTPPARPTSGEFLGDEIIREIEARSASVGIVTIAPELPGGNELVRFLRGLGHIVSIGHSGATYEQAREAIRGGITHATHLFNRMTPLTHRAPGVVGAVFESSAVCAEIICDGYHVHPASVSLAIRTKSVDRIMAITDGTAAAGLPLGARARLGGQPIVVGARSATLEDGTLAGSVATMDRAFHMLVHQAGLPLDQAARLCASSPASQLGLHDRGRLQAGLRADVVVLNRALDVVETWIGGHPVPEP
jgi:N-acetylglucosamine-6-phosphate deacetylase